MSTALGVASVTHVLKDLLNDGLINNNVVAALGTVVEVTSLPPGQIEGTNGNTTTQLNLFMYRITPNTGWSNTGYPSRNGKGEILNNPPLALDLHYLLTAFGESELHSEILLGYGMQILHENPVLVRSAIRTSLSAATAENPGGRLPANLLSLATSELAEQIEQIKITNENINLEDMSKLWTAFQTRYRPCSGYLATVVLIESNRTTNSPLPVQERIFHTFPFRQPVIEKVWSQGPAATDPILDNQHITVNDRLVLRGNQLRGERMAVLINGDPFPPLEESDTEVKVQVPATLRAGILGVQIVHFIEMGTPPENRRGTESNLLSFVLSPIISNQVLSNEISAGGIITSGDISVDVKPEVFRGQRIILLLNELNPTPGEVPRSYSFMLPTAFLLNENNAVTTITFPIRNVRVGNYLLRIQVDGAESPLTSNAGGYNAPQLNIS